MKTLYLTIAAVILLCLLSGSPALQFIGLGCAFGVYFFEKNRTTEKQQI